ncbi:hypothetical protein GCM10025863_14410 [Microbacterium suwonense]|uniref:Hydrolase n=1 Tax=Microbacterium suwonense TaxID=683047 RepID=A0ABM8FTI5_9MICO|nr:hypothetical protein GCM10025863_14410 [Microbacterium suwonense]
MADDDQDPSDFEEMLRRMMSGGQFDPEALREVLSNMQGDGFDPNMMSGIMAQMKGMFSGDPWQNAEQQALHLANRDGLSITSGAQSSLADAFGLANLWLSEATTISELTSTPQAMTRGEWVQKTLPVWKEIASPVSTSIADALTDALQTQVPEEMQGMVQGAGELMRGLGGSLFATQFGQVLGRLSLEVVSGETSASRCSRRGPPRSSRRTSPLSERGWRSPRIRSPCIWQCANWPTRGCTGTRNGCTCTCCRRSPTSRAE